LIISEKLLLGAIDKTQLEHVSAVWRTQIDGNFSDGKITWKVATELLGKPAPEGVAQCLGRTPAVGACDSKRREYA
jgi:hypothetical protein